MKSLFVLLLGLVIAVVYAAQSSAIVDCPVNEQRIYQYRSKIHSFGGTLKNNGTRKDDKNSHDGEHTNVAANVAITCVKTFPYKRNGNKLYLMHLRITDVKMNMTLDNHQEADLPNKSQAPPKPHFNQLFSSFTAFTMSAKGKIYKVFHAKQEEDWVTAMKKSIIAQLQVKYGTADRTEKDGIGKHTAHYKTKPQKDGSLVIQKKFTDKDVPKDASKSKRKQMRLSCKTKSLVDAEGHIQAVKRHEKVVFGTHHHGHKHPGFFSLRNVPYRNKTHVETKHDMWLNADEKSTLEFVKTAPFDENVTKHVRRNKADNEVMSSHEEFELHDDIVSSDLSVHEGILSAISKRTRKDLLHAQYNPKQLLRTLTEDPEDAIASTIMAEFVELDESVVDMLHDHFHNVSKTHGLDHAFLRLAQSLFASVNSTKAQEYLLNTLKSKDLIMHAMLKAAHVENPSDALIATVEHFATHAMKHNFSGPSAENALALNSFLILASMATKVSNDKQKEIILRILNEAQNTTSVPKMLFLIHALGNAGSAAPLSVLKQTILYKHTPMLIKLAAVEALRKRDDIEEDTQVSKLIHKIVGCKKCHTLVKLAAVKSQVAREENLANGRSVKFFKKFLLNKQTPAVIRKAIVDYYDSHGSDEAGEILLMSNVEEFMSESDNQTWNDAEEVYDEMSEAKFFKKIGRAFKKAAQSVGKAFKKVGQGIKNVAKKVGKGIVTVVKKVGNAIGSVGKKIKETIDKIKHAFAKATFQNNQVCIPASKKAGDNMCLYDQDMINFVASQGDMSNHNMAAHFTFEKLIGANKLNLYIGALGVAGTNFNCAEPPSEFEFVVAGRMEAKATVFSKKYSLITAHLTARQKNGEYYDKIYVRLLNNVYIDSALLPQDKISLCKEYSKPLYNKDFNNLPGLDMTIMIGPIPLSFGFKIQANARIDAIASYCLRDLQAKAGIQPSVSLGISGYAAIGIFIAKAGIRVEAMFNYGVFPNVNAKGLQCKICAQLDQVVKPMTLSIKAFADLNLFIFKTGGSWELFKWEAKAETKPLFQRCLDIPRLFGKKQMSVLSSNNELNTL